MTDLEGSVAELVGVEAQLEAVRRRLVRTTDTIAALIVPVDPDNPILPLPVLSRLAKISESHRLDSSTSTPRCVCGEWYWNGAVDLAQYALFTRHYGLLYAQSFQEEVDRARQQAT